MKDKIFQEANYYITCKTVEISKSKKYLRSIQDCKYEDRHSQSRKTVEQIRRPNHLLQHLLPYLCTESEIM